MVRSTSELVKNAAIGYVPGWLVMGAVLSFFIWLFYIIIHHRETSGELAYGEVHV